MRQIDADELIKQMGWKLGLGDEENGANVDYMEALEDCKELIDNAPTVNPEKPIFSEVWYQERPQGEWIKDNWGIFHCNYCMREKQQLFNNFCSNCGARLVRGGEKE